MFSEIFYSRIMEILQRNTTFKYLNTINTPNVTRTLSNEEILLLTLKLPMNINTIFVTWKLGKMRYFPKTSTSTSILQKQDN